MNHGRHHHVIRPRPVLGSYQVPRDRSESRTTVSAISRSFGKREPSHQGKNFSPSLIKRDEHFRVRLDFDVVDGRREGSNLIVVGALLGRDAAGPRLIQQVFGHLGNVDRVPEVPHPRRNVVDVLGAVPFSDELL